MEIGNKDIWQFGGQYIDSNTGLEATPEEVATFRKRALLDDEGQVIRAEQIEKSLQIEKDWHERYDSSIRNFFEYDEDEELRYYDDDQLAYDLATRMFDLTSGFNYFKKQHPDDWERQLDQVCHEVKETFPDHWKQALENFKNRCHDT